MIDVDEILAAAVEQLNSAHTEFEEARDGMPIEFHEMCLQASIFQYDIGADLADSLRNAPSGFTPVVALKVLVQRYFEYGLALSQLIQRLIALMKVRKLLIDQQVIKAQRKKWGVEFRKLRACHARKTLLPGTTALNGRNKQGR